MPRSPFQPLASSARKVSSAVATSSGVRATSKRDGAVLGQPMALPAQLLQLLGAERVAQQFVGIAGRIEAGAQMGCSTRGRRPSRRAPRRWPSSPRRRATTSRRISACAPASRAACIRRPPHRRTCRGRAAACTACRRDGRSPARAGESRRPAGSGSTGIRPIIGAAGNRCRRKRRGAGAAGCGCVHGQFPVGQIIAVRLDRAMASARHCSAAIAFSGTSGAPPGEVTSGCGRVAAASFLDARPHPPNPQSRPRPRLPGSRMKRQRARKTSGNSGKYGWSGGAI